MPELARFYGIVIRMYVEAGEPHKRPYFHAYYGGEVAIYGLAPVKLIAGGLPRKRARLVEAGRNSTKMNSTRTGSACSQASRRCRLSR